MPGCEGASTEARVPPFEIKRAAPAKRGGLVDPSISDAIIAAKGVDGS